MGNKKQQNNHKYKVILVAHKNLDKDTLKTLNFSSVKTIKNTEDLENMGYFCDIKGMNFNTRICIYNDWFREPSKEKLKEGYELAIIEVHKEVGASRESLLRKLDIDHKENILVVECRDMLIQYEKRSLK